MADVLREVQLALIDAQRDPDIATKLPKLASVNLNLRGTIVQPPCYVPLLSEVSGIGGRIPRA